MQPRGVLQEDGAHPLPREDGQGTRVQGPAHGNSGRRAAPGVLAGHTGLVDDLLRKGVTNSQVIFERLLGQGYAGGLTTVKTYIAAHRDLVPAKRRQAAPQGCRGQRFRTAPGEAYQMDWGFVAVERPGGERARIACFAMVCHHCGGAHGRVLPERAPGEPPHRDAARVSAPGVPRPCSPTT